MNQQGKAIQEQNSTLTKKVSSNFALNILRVDDVDKPISRSLYRSGKGFGVIKLVYIQVALNEERSIHLAGKACIYIFGPTKPQIIELVRELDGHVLRCVRDQNGNHVIQKCIESIPMEKIKFVLSSFRGQVAAVSTHPYGCRVIQRVLEHSTDELQSQFIVDEILESVYTLSQDQ